MKPFVVILISSSLLFGTNLKSEISSCSKVLNTLKRLECYDDTAKKHKLSMQKQTTRPSGKNRWMVTVESDPMTDKRVVTFINKSSKAKGKFGDPVVIVARCTQGEQAEFYINWSSFLGSDSTDITHRFDKEKAISSKWGLSTDNKASFYKNDIEDFFYNLIDFNTFTARAIPYNESPLTAEFDLSGFSHSIQQHTSTCGLLTNNKRIIRDTRWAEQEEQCIAGGGRIQWNRWINKRQCITGSEYKELD